MRRAGFAAALLGLAVAFALWRFPYEALARRLAAQATGPTRLEFATAGHGWPLGLRYGGARVTVGGAEVFDAGEVRLYPWWAALLLGRAGVRLVAAGGAVELCHVPGGETLLAVRGLDLAGQAGLRRFAGLAGRLELDVRATGPLARLGGAGTLRLAGAMAAVPLPGLRKDVLRLGDVTARLQLAPGRLKVEDLRLGPAGTADVSGQGSVEVGFGQTLETTSLRLVGEVRLDPGAADPAASWLQRPLPLDYSGSAAGLGRWLPGRGGAT